MKLKCIKTTGAHWGDFFREGEWYETHKIYSKSISIITNVVLYYDFIRDFLSEAEPFRKSGDMDALKIVNEKFKLNPCSKTIDITMCELKGLDKQTHVYCLDDKHLLAKIHGSHEFNVSVSFIQDYFINMDSVRNIIIDDILENL